MFQMPFIEHKKVISFPLGYEEWTGAPLLKTFYKADYVPKSKPKQKKDCLIGLTYSRRKGLREYWTDYFNNTYGPLNFPEPNSFDFVDTTRHCKFIHR
eukprot:UN26482